MTLGSTPLAVASASLVVAAVMTTLLVPLVRGLGLRLGLTDQPDSRKQHTTPMVRLGASPWFWVFVYLLG